MISPSLVVAAALLLCACSKAEPGVTNSQGAQPVAAASAGGAPTQAAALQAPEGQHEGHSMRAMPTGMSMEGGMPMDGAMPKSGCCN